MKDEQLKETLTNISKDIYDNFKDQAYQINSGGCVYFAWLMSKELESRNIKFKFSVCGNLEYPRSNYDNIALNLGTDKKYHISTWHGLLKINDYYYDSNGIKSDPSSENYYGEIIKNFQWISKQINNFYKNASWNPTFRESFDSKDIIKLKGIIKYNFKKYDSKIKNSVRYR